MPLDTDIARLSRVPFFSALGPSALRLLAFAAEPSSFDPGQYLFRLREAAEGGYLIVAGSVELLSGGDAEARVVGPGTLLGEQALLAEVSRPVSARAVTPTSALRITRTMVTRALREYPEGAAVLRAMWARRLHDRLTAE